MSSRAQIPLQATKKSVYKLSFIGLVTQNIFRMFMFDRKQKTLQQEKVDHTFIEKVLNVVKERVDNSQRDVYKLEQKIFKLPQKMQCNAMY